MIAVQHEGRTSWNLAAPVALGEHHTAPEHRSSPPVAPERVWDVADGLALRVKRREPGALGALYEALRPIIYRVLREQCRRARANGLPAALEIDDMRQETWLALAHLVDAWSPGRGAFAAYVSVTLPWALVRWVKRHSGLRRSEQYGEQSVPHERMVELAALAPGDDGRDWDTSIALRELLAELTERQRAIIGLRAVAGFTQSETAARLHLAHSTVKRDERAARTRLRLGWRPSTPPASEPADRPSKPAPARPLLCLIEALVTTRDCRTGTLAGRAVICRTAGLTQVAYGRLMADLVARGVIVGRGEREPGRLDLAKAKALLAGEGAK